MCTVIMKENLNKVHLKRLTLKPPRQRAFKHSLVIIEWVELVAGVASLMSTEPFKMIHLEFYHICCNCFVVCMCVYLFCIESSDFSNIQRALYLSKVSCTAKVNDHLYIDGYLKLKTALDLEWWGQNHSILKEHNVKAGVLGATPDLWWNFVLSVLKIVSEPFILVKTTNIYWKNTMGMASTCTCLYPLGIWEI